MRRPRIPGRLPSLGGSALHFSRAKLVLERSAAAATARREVAEAFASRIEPDRTVLERQIRDLAIAASRAAARGQPNTAIETNLDLLLRVYTRQPS
jgi:hypothetical protein